MAGFESLRGWDGNVADRGKVKDLFASVGVSGLLVPVVAAGIQIETAVLPDETRQAGRAVCRAGYSGTQTR